MQSVWDPNSPEWNYSPTLPNGAPNPNYIDRSKLFGGGTSAPLVLLPPPPAAPAAPAPPVDKPPARDFQADVRRLYPWIPSALVSTFADAWAKYGDPELALAEVRQSPNYETFFPGNRRDDGSFRLSEPEYLAVMEGYRQRWKAYGAPADLIEARLPDLVRNGVSPDEFGQRLDQTYVGLITQADPVRRFYAESYGAGDLSDGALFASAVLGDVDPLVVERRIRASQVGGEAAAKGFTRTAAEAERLASFGLDQAAASKLYGEAAKTLPTLNELIDRFDNPNDDLTIADYENAVVLNDPQQMAAVARLMGQVQSQFSQRSLYGRSQDGTVAGLLQR